MTNNSTGLRDIGLDSIGDLKDMARGAAILGGGGGGDPYLGRLLAEQAIREHGPVQLVTPAEIPDDALIVPVAMVGAPTAMLEKLPSGDEMAAALAALEDVLGRRVTHTLPIEVGGINSMFPIAIAARCSLPLIDADCMGRAFPELQMVLPTLGGVGTAPLSLADEHGSSIVIRTRDNMKAERLARPLVVEMGCSVGIASYPMTGREVKDFTVSGTLTLSARVGAAVRKARSIHADPVREAARVLGGVVVFTGKLTELDRRTADGFARGDFRLVGLGASDGSVEVSFQNENLVVRRDDGKVLVSVPDLICVLDAETGEPVTTEGLRYGSRVSIVGVPCDPRWRSAAGLEIVGPGCFGYDHDYQPMEAILR